LIRLFSDKSGQQIYKNKGGVQVKFENKFSSKINLLEINLLRIEHTINPK
jgi:hypothetical protein